MTRRGGRPPLHELLCRPCGLAGSGRDHVENQRLGLAASLGVGIDTATRSYVNLLYIDQDNVPDGYVPTIGLPGWEPQPGLDRLVGNPVASTNFYGTRGDYDHVDRKSTRLNSSH